MTPPRYRGGCLVLRDELYSPAVWTEPEDDYDRCSQCGAEKPDVVGLVVMDVAPGMEAEDFGFCSIACFILHVRERYIECVRATATPAEAPGPPSGRVSAGIGAAQGRGSLGSARPVQAAPTSEAGVVPRCSAVDWLSGATCNKVAGHFSADHASEDQDFEIRWPRA